MPRLSLLTRTALLLAITVSIQALRLPQPFTGPLVNMMLILTVLSAGVPGAVMVGGLTPWLGVLFGIVPGQMLPVLPFLMAGNALYCLVFGRFQTLLGVAVGSMVKFAFIAGAAQYILSLPPTLPHMLALPQLTNALAGGLAGVILGRAYLPAINKFQSAGNRGIQR